MAGGWRGTLGKKVLFRRGRRGQIEQGWVREVTQGGNVEISEREYSSAGEWFAPSEIVLVETFK